MFNNNYGNGGGGNNINVSTRFRSFVSETSMLTVGGWNQNLSIRIVPAIGQDANGQFQYDRNRALQTALTQTTARALYEGYKKVLLPKIIANEPDMETVSVSVAVGKDDKRSIVSLERVPNQSGHDLYLTVYTLLDNNNIANDANVFRHKFAKSMYVESYDYKTGQGNVVEENVDFFNFIDILDATLREMIPAQYHTGKYEQAVAQSYGNRNNNGGNSNQGGGFNNNGFGSQMQNPGQFGGFGSFNGNDELPFN